MKTNECVICKEDKSFLDFSWSPSFVNNRNLACKKCVSEMITVEALSRKIITQ